MSTTTNLDTLKINYLTQAQYQTALDGGQINENEIYLTPSSNTNNGFGTPITISLDSSWVAPSDGIINLRVDWTSGSYGYYYVQNETDNTIAGAISNAGSLGGMTITTSFPVIQGKSYKKSMSAQIGSSVVTFYPFG